ncbi:uncharacterized protein TRIADDRAFT_19777 [Trichoplax adhaerens]|uniref:Major facilitator superfamily (MFS) profile domain-containing protein n=1 Tax=Trichoplax adhaerens TaxID=10228 RepID=B3RM63_TRIAD|nr:hypothetical protein TRIADDRAFT_19777 [Trichoplax adhaerens]EDV29641.1 hypothetical protein TRIADDRAFT_19777 [Trichoplax adhaerens]|eukprot:XP_002108843.1 hypothetical protein TRIADDRAFT_19777 [Trichoplax adhaerens]
MADSTARRAPPDGGWGWVIAGVAFIINGIILGIHNSFGLFLDYFIENHVFGVTDKDTAAVAAVGSLSFGMTFMFGPLSGILCDQVGLRLTVIIGSVIAVAGVLTTSFCNELYQLYITYGVLWGCGSSLCYTASFVALGRYFHKRISFVNGLATAGSGIGGLALTPLINWLLTTSDWRVTYQVLAGVCSLLAICGIFVRPADPSKSKKTSCLLSKKITSCLDFSNWRKKSYIAWVLSAAVVETCYFTPYIYLVSRTLFGYISNMLVAYLGIVATASKLLVGKICDHPKMNRVYFTQICILFMAVCITCLPLTTNYGGVLAFVIVFGWFDGCYTALLAVITLDVTGPAKYAQGLGQLYIVMSINNIFGPIIIGKYRLIR